MLKDRISVLCVDDHSIVRQGISALIGGQKDFEVVGSAASGEEAVAMFRALRPDVTLMDLQLHGMSGLEAIGQIRHQDPEARIVVLTMYHGDEDIRRALQAGAVTYLLKETLAEDLVRTIRQVHHGERPVQRDVQAVLAEYDGRPTLTRREVEVVELISQGMRNKEIAAALGIGEVTVQVHVRNILAKLNVNDRTAAVNVALRRGIIHI